MSLVRLGLAWTVCLALATAAWAHPMPNTVIAITLDDDGARIEVAIPLSALRLALPEAIRARPDLLSEPQRSALIAYLQAHCSVRSGTGTTLPVTVSSIALSRASDDNVGLYEELRVEMVVKTASEFDPHQFSLMYDVLIHQVPTHVALVQIIRGFRDGVVVSAGPVDIGTIRFDYASNLTPPFPVVRAPSGVWKGFGAAVSLGFAHVASGFDHWLFLVTLLIVAPLRSIAGCWSLFQGWRYTAKRFLGISLAFTCGHSGALMFGAYGLVPVPREAIEVFIAASILIAAVHAVKPLFPEHEWLVAATFGTIHGLAFSESLDGAALTPWIRALAVAGFNLGVEGAQLLAMASAAPLVAASRWRTFHSLRTGTMVCAALLAGFWMLDRAQLVRWPDPPTMLSPR